MKWVAKFPRAFRLDIVVVFALALMVLQLAVGTTLEFAELTFLAIFFSALAINFAGGLQAVAGCCIAVVACKTFLIAEIAKVCFGEPGQTNLEQPTITMGVMALSMAAICLASLVSISFRSRWVLLAPTQDDQSLKKIAIIALIIGIGSFFVAQFLGVSEEGAVRLGGVPGLLRRISACAPLAIVAGTAYTIQVSQGKRLLSAFNIVPFAIQFGVGILFTSKQALFDPFFYTTVTGIAFGFAWRRLHFLSGISIVFIAFFVLFPFGQVTRSYTRGANIRDTYKKTVDFFNQNLHNPNFFVNQYLEYKEGVEEDAAGRYFSRPSGLLERFSLIKPADLLVSATLKQGQGGWETINSGLADLLPRLILPRRYVDVPNALGYQAGIVDEDNNGTDIAFGFAAHAFYAFGWTGVALGSFFIGVLLIVVTRLLTSGLPNNVWAVVFLGSYQHMIAEALIGGVLQILLYQTAWTLAALFAVRLLTELWRLGEQVLRRQKRGWVSHHARPSPSSLVATAETDS
jgi:hypothetical protein